MIAPYSCWLFLLAAGCSCWLFGWTLFFMPTVWCLVSFFILILAAIPFKPFLAKSLIVRANDISTTHLEVDLRLHPI